MFSSYSFFFSLCCYSLTSFAYWNPRKIAKKKVRYKLDSLSFFTLRYEWVNTCVYVFTSMHMLDFMFQICVVCINNKKWNNRMTRGYYFTISRERSAIEILVRSSIFSEFQTKVDFKVTAFR